MFKGLGKLLANIARVVVVSMKVGRDLVAGVVRGIGGQSRGGSFKDIPKGVSNYWHTTLRPKGYVKPHEIGASEVAQAQNEIRMQPVDMSQVQTQGKSMQVEPRVSVSHGVSNAPTMHM